jgi:hypothetical protein
MVADAGAIAPITLTLAGQLKSTQRNHDRVEQEEQHQRAVLIHVARAIARFIALAAHLVQPLIQRKQPSKVLQADNVLVRDSLLLLRHET